ncbi:MAG: DUF1343 domain-containing protein, partial [Bacteroidales bacterium]|nr:DUF1343 domain-containing protein [Bacteroidales bacterium]
MFSFRTTPLLEQTDTILRSGRLGLFCNQTSWHPENGEYLYETLFNKGLLKRVFVPEEGLFGEYSEFKLKDNEFPYNNICLNKCGFESLYKIAADSVIINSDKLKDLDGLIIDLQDTGVRYSRFNSVLSALFLTLKKRNINLSVYIIDRLNPLGRQVEGTMLRKEYQSSSGVEGIPHRHGLTLGELANLLYNEQNDKFPLHIISSNAELVSKSLLPWSIPPDNDMPGLFSPFFYAGQYLWCVTNVSGGRGTLRPFEQFGAPFMSSLTDYNIRNGFRNWNDPGHPLYDPAVYIRWQRFIPSSGKYKGELCFGFQLHPVPGVHEQGVAPRFANATLETFPAGTFIFCIGVRR